MDNKPCTICENSKKNNKKGEDGKKSFSDSTLNALIQEEVMSESNTSESLPVFKNKEQKNQPLAKLNAQSEFFSTKKNTYIDEHENNESSEIEDVDFGEDEPKNLFVNKQTGPIIKQNSHILAKSTQTNQSNQSQSNSSSASIDQVLYSYY